VGYGPWHDLSAIQDREDGVAIDVEVGRQLVDLGTGSVLGYQLADTHGVESVLSLPGGSNFGLFWTRAGHFEQGLDGFSLVRKV
jgi:hypothetical protein